MYIFRVLDTPDNFNVAMNPPEAVIGMDFKLTCRASKFDFKNSIEWFKDEVPLTTGKSMTNKNKFDKKSY